MLGQCMLRDKLHLDQSRLEGLLRIIIYHAIDELSWSSGLHDEAIQECSLFSYLNDQALPRVFNDDMEGL